MTAAAGKALAAGASGPAVPAYDRPRHPRAPRHPASWRSHLPDRPVRVVTDSGWTSIRQYECGGAWSA